MFIKKVTFIILMKCRFIMMILNTILFLILSFQFDNVNNAYIIAGSSFTICELAVIWYVTGSRSKQMEYR